MKPKETLIEDIVQREEAMFLAVTPSEPSACQDRIKTFRRMREMSHWVLPEQVLASILLDLGRAEYAGRNLMVEKYARMENKIPRTNFDPLIAEIVHIEAGWHRELCEKYPLTFRDRGGLGETYFSCELETYSHETLELYYAALTLALSEKRNLVAERYTHLFQTLGYDSIDDMEKKQKTQPRSD